MAAGHQVAAEGLAQLIGEGERHRPVAQEQHLALALAGDREAAGDPAFRQPGEQAWRGGRLEFAFLFRQGQGERVLDLRRILGALAAGQSLGQAGPQRLQSQGLLAVPQGPQLRHRLLAERLVLGHRTRHQHRHFGAAVQPPQPPQQRHAPFAG